MIRFPDILDAIQYLPATEQQLIQKAYVFSAAAHAGQMRLSGEPYLSHPLAVSYLLAQMRLDAATIAAGLLHDTVEDTSTGIEDIDAQFGEEVADIVDGVTKISQMQMTFDSREDLQAENIRKMVMAMSEDIRVLLVKLTDRLHNMRTLDHQKSHKQRLIAQETMDIYAPLANRLGLHLIKIELEDISLRYLKPDIYAQIARGLKERDAKGQQYIATVQEFIEKTLKKNRLKGQVSGRVKHVYSTWRKMVQQDLSLDQVHDIIAFRIIVSSIKTCYAVLGLVHANWRPVPGRFKDYISMPKANMYQSLHTTVIGPEGERIEIQIRTEEMHRLAEFGVAAHWSYKEKGVKKAASKNSAHFSWLRQIMDWQKEESDPKEFLRSLRFDLFKDEVYVFTPDGDVKELPEGATGVDFAYLIHSEVGDHCTGVRINGRLVPLARKLKNGDVIEIITDPKRSPGRDWLKFVKTAKARTRIKQFIRAEERINAINLAKDMLEKEGRRMGINVARAMKQGDFDEVLEEFSLKNLEQLFIAVGYSRLTARQVLNKLHARTTGAVQEQRPEASPAEGPDKTAGDAEKVQIKGVDDVLVRFAQCCNPLPGDPIIGYISRGRGVTVHTADCPNAARMEPERLLSIFWESQQDEAYCAKVKTVCKNEPGSLAAIASLLARERVNIDSGKFTSDVGGNSEIILTVEVADSTHLYALIDKLCAMPCVHEATRLASSSEN